MPCVVLLARQRSGTGVLSLALGAHPDIIACDEILHPAGLTRPYNFYGWRARRQEPFRTVSDLCLSFRLYLDALSTRKRWLLLDIKISNLRDFSEPFTMGPPWILDELKRRQIPFIWLRRRNLIDVWVSGQLAALNGLFHAYPEQVKSIRAHKVKVSRHDLEGFVKYARQEDTELEVWLEHYPNIICLHYEDLFAENGQFATKPLQEIADMLNVSVDSFPRNPLLAKQTIGSLQDKIENYSEIADLVDEHSGPSG